MKTGATRVSGLAIGLVALALACEERNPLSVSAAGSEGISASRERDDDGDDGRAVRVRWDIVNVLGGGAAAGGSSSSKSLDGARITFTGRGTFEAPAGGGGSSSAVTGGGTWTIAAGTATPASAGTYRVTGLVRWEPAPGTLPAALPDLIGNREDARPGFVILRIRYSDGSRGILVVGCRLVGSPGSIAEGITATKGFVDFWNHEEPTAGVEGNRTLFHVRTRGRDD